MIETEFGNVNDFGEWVSSFWAMSSEIIFSITILMMTIGGFIFITSGGSENRAKVGKKIIFGAIFSVILVIFSAVFQKIIQKPSENMTKISEIPQAISRANQIFLNFLGGVSVIAIIFLGFNLIFSRGNEEKIATVKRGIFLAIFGISVAILGSSLIYVVKNFTDF